MIQLGDMRTLSFLHHGDYMSYNKRIYKVDWTLKDNNNIIDIKSNQPCNIDEHKRVKWLRNFNNFTLIK